MEDQIVAGDHSVRSGKLGWAYSVVAFPYRNITQLNKFGRRKEAGTDDKVGLAGNGYNQRERMGCDMWNVITSLDILGVYFVWLVKWRKNVAQ